MKLRRKIDSGFSAISRYRYKWVLLIGVSWTLIDVISWVLFMQRPYEERSETTFQFLTPGAIVLRSIIVFAMSTLMGYLLVFKLKKILRRYPLIVSLLLRTLFLIIAAFIMNFIVHVTYSWWTLHLGVRQSLVNFEGEAIHRSWIFGKMTNWVIIFLVTQLLIEINEKYSPGVFFDILIGKYLKPRIENRIIMFMDLKDSTTIAEQLGHQEYFLFIRDFIYYLSSALLEYEGRIYQYVGDEVVVSWGANRKNAARCVGSLIAARRAIQKASEHFRRSYKQVPEFRVGIHAGNVTVGEIGVIKKDLAMSGDTMNTTARIRSACSELNQKFIVSKDFLDLMDLKEWQAESLGPIELKGKADGVELYALKI
jgi:adenylate cyclase